MSRIGNKPISLPKGVEVKKDNGKVVVKGWMDDQVFGKWVAKIATS